MDRKELERKIFWKYFFRKGRFINFKSPKLFTEKIQWLKVYDCTPIKTRLADKIAVREWIKEKIGEEYLKKVLMVFEKAEDINFSKLPKIFVLKTNHGSKMQMIFLNRVWQGEKYKKRFKEYLKADYALKSYEMHYHDIKPVIFAEEYLENTNELFEYLIFCFNGEPKLILFASGKNDDIPKSTMFDTDWNNLHFNYGVNSLHEEEIPRPKNFDKMLEIAKILSKDFKFVRVDLHNIDGKIYFGEMTFTPASGYMKFSDRKWDRIMGDMLDLK